MVAGAEASYRGPGTRWNIIKLRNSQRRHETDSIWTLIWFLCVMTAASHYVSPILVSLDWLHDRSSLASDLENLCFSTLASL
jgi:hypothetical protein